MPADHTKTPDLGAPEGYADQGDGTFSQIVVLGAAGGAVGNGVSSFNGGEIVLFAADKRRRHIEGYVDEVLSSGNLHLGAAGVLSTNAPPLKPGAAFSIDKAPGAEIRATSTGPVTVSYYIERTA